MPGSTRFISPIFYRYSTWTALLLVFLVAGGCSTRRGEGEDPGPGSGQPMGTLTLTPMDPVLTVDGKTPVTQAFRVFKGKEDVTDRASLWVDDGRMGFFQGATFTSNPGAAGKTAVRARLEQDLGQTTISLRVKAVIIAPGTTPDADKKFNGPKDQTRAPEIAYPPPGVLIPPNLNELEFQFDPKGGDLFEISLQSDGLDLRIYTKCNPVGTGCGLIPDELSWRLLSQTSRGKIIKVSIRGTLAAGGNVGTSAEQDLSFGDDDIRGGIYYWGATAAGIFRYDFGRRGQKAEAFYTPGPQAGLVTCVGCHAISRNGKRIAVGLNIPGPAQMRAVEVATRKTLFEVGTGLLSGSNYQTFTADGSKLVTTEGGGLTLRDGQSGAVLSQTPAIANANMPDFSPDNSQLVFARGQPTCMFGICQTLSALAAGLYVIPFTGDGFGQAQVLVPPAAGQNNYYPSFSPDGKYIVFNRASGDSYDAMDARVLVVASGGGMPVDLAAVNDRYQGNSWPKWAPFVQRFAGQTVFWLTFSSRRPYGLRNLTAAQLWMVPVVPGKLAEGKDSGYPPFWLPFQNMMTGNHIAQWVERVERAPCTKEDTSQCAPSEVCENGMCVPIIK